MDARQRITEVVTGSPRSEQPGALCALGDELLERGDLDGGLASFDQALKLDPRSVTAWVGRGVALAKKNRAGEALGCVERALESDGGHGPALRLKVTVLRQIGARDEALATCDEALRSSMSAIPRSGAPPAFGGASTDDAVLWIERAQLQAELGRHREAAASYEHVLEQLPAAPDHWHALAIARRHIRDDAGVKVALDRFLELAPATDPRVPAARSLLARIGRYAPRGA